jgi:heme-degrading monooxygenase HmoA
MIVRVTRAQIKQNSEPAVFEILRDASKGVSRPPGMEGLHIGRRMGVRANELISVTIWTDIEALRAAMGTSMEVAAFLPQLEPHLVGGTVEHFETVIDRFENLDEIGR